MLRVKIFCKVFALLCFELLDFENPGQIGTRAVRERVKNRDIC
jgi:hypothetical protein